MFLLALEQVSGTGILGAVVVQELGQPQDRLFLRCSPFSVFLYYFVHFAVMGMYARHNKFHLAVGPFTRAGRIMGLYNYQPEVHYEIRQ